ncbi:amidase [Streptomyces sp. CC224B]|uniref:amidase n=1 Tax=Streptomyces sp. CC224B TaxID=3044571 RepID=UPI0024A7C22B|nr:amidase [Streptomyces sp. CC224B]
MGDDDLCFLGAGELAWMVRERVVSVREVVGAFLGRVERVNPVVNALVTVDGEGVMGAAARADEQVVRGEGVGVLRGVPVGFKDTHLTRGMRTTRGSRVFAEWVPDEDELVVARVQGAGALRLGKTNVPEFGAGSHTFNAVFGATRNPYDTGRSAGGSSGGAAAALAAGLLPLADGSDMGGSLRNPASFCNVVGLRPTPGRVPSYPAVNAWDTLTVPGPMARSVGDVALLLSAMAGPDPRCPLSLETPPAASFRAPLERDTRGLRVAWAPDLGGRVPVDPDVREVLARQAAVFEALGWRVEEACPDLDGADAVFRVERAHSFALALGAVLDDHRELLKPTVVWNIEEGRKLTAADLAAATAEHTRMLHAAVAFFERYDVLVAPVSQVAPFAVEREYPDVVDGRAQETYIDWMRSAFFVSLLGGPALAVPAGFTEAGLPVGVQIVGPPRAERAVLEAGAAFEAATGWGRRRPAL